MSTCNEIALKSSYSCLNVLQERNARYSYIPFDQGAMAHLLDQPDWEGSCSYLSWAWIYRKLKAGSIQEPTSYKITASHLPHPVIAGDNAPYGKDIPVIKNQLMRHLGHQELMKQEALDERFFHCKIDPSEIETLKKKLAESGCDQKQFYEAFIQFRKVKVLLAYLREVNSPGCDSRAVYLSAFFRVEDKLAGHACAFVKTGDQCAWFDPNHGELNFDHFDDFARWFTEETTCQGEKSGALLFLIRPAKQTETSTSRLFGTMEFTVEEENENPIAKRMVERRRELSTDKKVTELMGYSLFSFSFSSRTHQSFKAKAPVL